MGGKLMRLKLLTQLGIAAALSLLTTAPAAAEAITSTMETSVPIAITVFIPCASDVVPLTGSLHIVAHQTVDASGGFHFSILFNPQGVSGVGTLSGAEYQGTGETRFDTQTSGPPPFNFTFVNNFKIIGQGPDNNLLIHQNVHVTFNADGTMTASVNNFSFVCM
jgi:hypothetical protein